MGLHHSTRCLPCPYMVKHLKYFFFWTQKALRLNLGIQHQGLKGYLVCWNTDTRMTVDLFLVRSNLCPSCCGKYWKKLLGICRYAIAVFIRWANCGPWAFCFQKTGYDTSWKSIRDNLYEFEMSNLFFGKNKKNDSVCCLLKILPWVKYQHKQ